MDKFSANVRLQNLKVDYSYQRDPRPSWVNKIVREYDPAQVRQLILSKRDDGTLYVIDGNHTKEATLRVVGENAELPASIFTGLSVKDEAELFYKYNSNSKKVRFGEKLKANVTSGDKKATEYVRELNASGIDWSYSGGSKSGPFEAHNGAMKLLDAYGEDVFVDALRTLFWTGNHSIYTAYTLGGICYLIKYTNIDKHELAKKLTNVKGQDLKQHAAVFGKFANDSGELSNRAFANVLLIYYNNRKQGKNKIVLPEM